MTRQAISTRGAPEAIGTYSQAVRAGDTVYLSGQIPLDPESMELVSGLASRSTRCSATCAPSPRPRAAVSATS